MDLSRQHNDRLGVLTTTLLVVQRSQHVRIITDRIPLVAAELLQQSNDPPGWNDSHHYRDGSWRTAAWVLLLDALNFCFWSEDPDPRNRWRVAYQGTEYDGYWALVAALRRAVDGGWALWDSAFLASISAEELAHLLRPVENNTPPIPLFDRRLANVRELGAGLQQISPDSETAVTALITGVNRSAVRLVEEVVRRFPSFNDVARYPVGTIPGLSEIRFYKRAQILAADLHGAFGGEEFGSFNDLDQLTAFADYKVPQVLRHLGLLAYDDALADAIDQRTPIPDGSPAEVEIRAATIWAVELLRQEASGVVRAFEIDWALWQLGQSLPRGTRPHHRSHTVYY